MCGPSIAGPHECKAIEFAELQTLSKTELKRKLCEYQGKFDSANERARSKSQASLESFKLSNQLTLIGSSRAAAEMQQSEEYSRESNQSMKDINGCQDEMSRVSRIMVKKNIPTACN